jgi:DNA repair protein SbcC/Rad50
MKLQSQTYYDDEKRKLQSQLTPFVDALAVLDNLTDKHKLSDAMEEALAQNKGGIESIFLRVHAPDEFAGLGDSFSTLRRKSGEEAILTQITTGQRAAFALSIFLCHNAQLRMLPPLCLLMIL